MRGLDYDAGSNRGKAASRSHLVKLWRSWIAALRKTKTIPPAYEVAARNEGFVAFQHQAVCPYPHDRRGDAWRQGWEEAKAFSNRAV